MAALYACFNPFTFDIFTNTLPLARSSLQISQIYKVQYFSPNKISPHRGSGSCNQHNGVNKAQKNTFSWWVLQVCTFVHFLAFISLELVYPVLWPFCHRLTSTKTYVYSIVIFWVPGVWLFTTYHKNKLCASLIYHQLFSPLLGIRASCPTIS